MRITGGRWRGRVLDLPGGGEVRPTASKVREALFSMLGQDLAGWSVLDAFAGAGLLGVEAASRGAAPVLLLDRDPAVVRALRGLPARLGAGDALQVRRGEAAQVLGAPGAAWDLVLLDPPYAEDPLAWLARGAPVARRALVLEHRWGPALPATAGALVQLRHRRYGDTGLALYVRPDLIDADRPGDPGDDPPPAG